MKFAFIGTYPPRQCGIGTFTKNLRVSMLGNINDDEPDESFVVALDNHQDCGTYPKEVGMTIQQDSQTDYLEAAKYINLSGADVCILEHEFGIFGGQNGVYILPLLHRLEIPLIVTLHTILKKPSYNEKAVLREICKMADKIVVMSLKAIDFLIGIYKVKISKIAYIQHGVPDILFGKQKVKKDFKLENKKVILTFGFLGRNKGIETVIKALPEIIKKHPDAIYIILGKTHPNVLQFSGEEYRISLMQLVSQLGMEDHVLFLNEFIEQKELFKYLSACDIYVTPYLNEAQITSGTLSYAIGVGAAVVSTPYWHAQELLDEGRGVLFKFNDYKKLAKVINKLFDNPEEIKKFRTKAFEYGRTITWPKTGKKYVELAEKLKQKKPVKTKLKEIRLDPLMLPPFTLEHVKRLTDDTGIIQHAKFGIPNLKDGYCLDDNARALLMVIMAYKQLKSNEALKLCPIYLSYIHYMQLDNGMFRNFLSFKREFLDDEGSEDSFGRAVWALGYLLGNPPNDAYYQSGSEIFFKAAQNFEKLSSLRSIAYTIMGISHYLSMNKNDENMIQVMTRLSKKIIDQYMNCRTDSWRWFENIMSYDNGIIPLGLLHAEMIIKGKKMKEVAFESMDFLTETCIKDNSLSIIGNQNWYEKGKDRSRFAQQPVDALAMVLMFRQAYLRTKEKAYLDKLYTCFMWFLGENDLRMNLYDFETNGCCDGLEKYGVNRNQGAESALAYLISHLTVLQAFEDYH
jgi:glycosyltransferase involved in cell wall biosynthesis